MKTLKAVSRQAAVSMYSDMNVSTITTSAIEQYIRNFFEVDGKYRRYLMQFAPSMARYTVEKDHNPSDTTKTLLTLERYNERIAAHPPCIIINDTGVVLKPAGFGRSTWQSRPQSSVVMHQIAVTREVPITIFIAASSKSELVSLAQCMHAIFFDISTFINGKIIHSDNHTDTWSLRIPMMIDPGSYDKNNQGDDPQMQLWTSTISMQITFEDSFNLTDDDMSYTVSPGSISGPEISFPNVLKIGRRTSGMISNLMVDMKVVIDNHNLASISHGSTLSEYIILAKRPGEFNIQVIQGTKTGSNIYPGQGSAVRPDVIAQKKITVTF